MHVRELLLAPLMRICERDKPALKSTFLKWIRDQVKPLNVKSLAHGSSAILGGPFLIPDSIPDLDNALRLLRSIAATLQQESGLEQVLDRLMRISRMVPATPITKLGLTNIDS